MSDLFLSQSKLLSSAESLTGSTPSDALPTILSEHMLRKFLTEIQFI